MDKAANNLAFAQFLENQVAKILEADVSNRPWQNVDKAKLPMTAFLWVGDPGRVTTWRLPFREADVSSGIDSSTGRFSQAGPVNLNALRAISAAIGGARTGNSMTVPTEIRRKIERLLRQHKIGKFAEADGVDMDKGTELAEALQFEKSKIDKENCIIEGVAVLRPTSRNKTNRRAKGRRYTAKAMESAKTLIQGKKAYINHVTREELESRNGVRDIRDVLGWWDDHPRIDEEGVLRDDLHYLPQHAAWLEPMVEKMADKIGASIHAYGPQRFNEADLMEDVMDLYSMRSADIVTEPGSTFNLFENLDEDQGQPDEQEESMEIGSLTAQELREQRPDLVEAFATEFKAGADVEKQVESLTGQVSKLTADNQKLREDKDALEVKEAVRTRETEITDLVTESKIPTAFVTKTFLESLSRAEDKKEMQALIEDRKKIVESAGKVTGMGEESNSDADAGDTKESKETPEGDKTLVEALGQSYEEPA